MFYKGNAIKKQVRQYIKLLLFPVALDHLNIILIVITFTMLYLLNRLFGNISLVLKEDNVIVSRANELFYHVFKTILIKLYVIKDLHLNVFILLITFTTYMIHPLLLLKSIVPPKGTHLNSDVFYRFFHLTVILFYSWLKKKYQT